jgi:hypothetical protein
MPKKCCFLNLLFINAMSISNQYIANAGSFNITILPILLPTTCQEFAFWISEGNREERKKERKEIGNI